MKKVLITYHMTNGEEDAETCIAPPTPGGPAAPHPPGGDDRRFPIY